MLGKGDSWDGGIWTCLGLQGPFQEPEPCHESRVNQAPLPTSHSTGHCSSGQAGNAPDTLSFILFQFYKIYYEIAFP